MDRLTDIILKHCLHLSNLFFKKMVWNKFGMSLDFVGQKVWFEELMTVFWIFSLAALAIDPIIKVINLFVVFVLSNVDATIGDICATCKILKNKLEGVPTFL